MKKTFLIAALACQLIAMIRRATTELLEALQRLFDQAGRASVVIYTMSAAGLQTPVSSSK